MLENEEALPGPASADDAMQTSKAGTFTGALVRLEDVSETFSAALQALETITCPEKVRAAFSVVCSFWCCHCTGRSGAHLYSPSPTNAIVYMQQVSGITRKRLALRAVEKLDKTQEDTNKLQEDLLQLQEKDSTQQARMDEQLQAHHEQGQALSKCRHQVMMLHDRLQEHELVIQEHEQAAEAAAVRVRCYY